MKNLLSKLMFPILVLSLTLIVIFANTITAFATPLLSGSVMDIGSEEFLILLFSNPFSISALALTLWAYFLTHNPKMASIKDGWKQLLVILTCIGLTLIAWKLQVGLWSQGGLFADLKWSYQIIIGTATGALANRWYDNKLFENLLILIKALKPKL